jgi:hypothetical protein
MKMNLSAKQKTWQGGREMYHPESEDYSVLQFIPDGLKTYVNFQMEAGKI